MLESKINIINFNCGEEMGRNSGTGQGKGRGEGKGMGRNKGGAFGPGGDCVCPKCGEKVTHQRGLKCTEIKCPKCGNRLVREELLNK